jgi:5-methylthioadenosine/S-adenosylhomocysteine deaminase
MSDREPVDLLIEPRWLLPIAPGNVALEGHAIAVSGGRIAALGPATELRQRFAPRERVVRERHALLPGLVNAHTRACHTLLRGLPVHGPRLRWLTERVAPLERAGLSADFVRDGTRAGIAEMLRAGMTCFAD